MHTYCSLRCTDLTCRRRFCLLVNVFSHTQQWRSKWLFSCWWTRSNKADLYSLPQLPLQQTNFPLCFKAISVVCLCFCKVYKILLFFKALGNVITYTIKETKLNFLRLDLLLALFCHICLSYKQHDLLIDLSLFFTLWHITTWSFKNFASVNPLTKWQQVIMPRTLHRCLLYKLSFLYTLTYLPHQLDRNNPVIHWTSKCIQATAYESTSLL